MERFKMVVKTTSVQPTRGELLKLKKRINLAKRGHELLKEKQDALVAEFFDILDKLDEVRDDTQKKLDEAFKQLIESKITIGTLELEKSAKASVRDIELDISTRNIMGVKVPIIESGDIERKVIDRGYSLYQTSGELDEAAREFEKALKSIIELAEIETTVKMLAKEIEKTKRRVNSLEHVLIPRLEESREYIEMRLEELERENFFRLKRVKAIIE